VLHQPGKPLRHGVLPRGGRLHRRRHEHV
jgi:hypothetical protein